MATLPNGQSTPRAKGASVRGVPLASVVLAALACLIAVGVLGVAAPARRITTVLPHGRLAVAQPLTSTATATALVPPTVTVTLATPTVTATLGIPSVTATLGTPTVTATLAAATSPAATRPAPALYLPRVARDVGSWPDADLADRIWAALEAFEHRNRLAALVPMEGITASLDAAMHNVDAACKDFPDIPDVFGAGTQSHGCQMGVADAFGLYHAVRALRLVQQGRAITEPTVVNEHQWAEAYLAHSAWAVQLFLFDRFEFVNPFHPEQSPRRVGFRDTRAAIWQNTQRAMELGLVADVTARTGELSEDVDFLVDDALISSARAWRTAFWSTGRMPNSPMDFTTHTAAEATATSLKGESVAPTLPISIHWDADKHNTPAEEMAWMGAGVVIAMQVAGDRIPAAERAELVAAGRHYLDYAVTYNRPDPKFGGTIRTVGDEVSGGPYGQNRYWIENHQDDAPSLPYLGYTWASLGIAHLTTDRADGRPWPSFAPPEAWPVLARSAEATLIMPDGQSIADLRPGSGIGFDVERYPLWTMPCGEHHQGALYIDAQSRRRAGGPRYVSEIGHPAGLSILLVGVPLVHVALGVGDLTTAARWQRRLDVVLDAYTASPPGFEAVPCKVAPWVSAEPAYHWAYMINAYLYPWLQASGYRVGRAP